MTCRIAVRKLVIGCLLMQLLAISRETSAQGAEPPDSLEARRRVYIPVEELDVIVDRDHEGVILSREEYQRLVDLATKERARVLPTEREVAVSRAEYSAEVA